MKTRTYDDSLLPVGWTRWDQDERDEYTRRTGFSDWPDQRPQQDTIADMLTSGTSSSDSLKSAMTQALNTSAPSRDEQLALNGDTLTRRLATALGATTTIEGHPSDQQLRDQLEIY